MPVNILHTLSQPIPTLCGGRYYMYSHLREEKLRHREVISHSFMSGNEQSWNPNHEMLASKPDHWTSTLHYYEQTNIIYHLSEIQINPINIHKLQLVVVIAKARWILSTCQSVLWAAYGFTYLIPLITQ